MPSEAGPGVTDPVFVRSVNQDFTRSVELNVLGEGGAVGHWEDGNSNIQVTEHADGTRSALAQLHWAGGVDIEVRGPADADGFNPDDFEAVVRAENVPEGARRSLTMAFTNDPDAANAVEGRGPIELRLTADDIAEIQDRVRPYLDRGGTSPTQDLLLEADDPIQFVARLAAMQGGFTNTADTLSGAMLEAGDGPLPGEFVSA